MKTVVRNDNGLNIKGDTSALALVGADNNSSFMGIQQVLARHSKEWEFFGIYQKGFRAMQGTINGSRAKDKGYGAIDRKRERIVRGYEKGLL